MMKYYLNFLWDYKVNSGGGEKEKSWRKEHLMHGERNTTRWGGRFPAGPVSRLHQFQTEGDVEGAL